MRFKYERLLERILPAGVPFGVSVDHLRPDGEQRGNRRGERFNFCQRWRMPEGATSASCIASPVVVLLPKIDPVNLVLVVGKLYVGKFESRLAGVGTEVSTLLATVSRLRHGLLGVNWMP